MSKLYEQLLGEFQQLCERREVHHTNASWNQGFDSFVRVRLFELKSGGPEPARETNLLEHDVVTVTLTSAAQDAIAIHAVQCELAETRTGNALREIDEMLSECERTVFVEVTAELERGR